MLDPPILPNHICTSSGSRRYGTGARYSISCRAMSVSTPASSTRLDHRRVGRALAEDRRPEDPHTRLFEQLQHRRVVDVVERVQIAPSQVDRDVQARQSRVSLRCVERCGLAASGPRRSILLAS
jgi:hypothetical protein